ncbi:hypothetical protein [Flavimobilis marinus]|uniref:hypothetical protein n=1 Tax=Flavimobilis marinus TaxID=285351 RepID=UPI0015A529C4|nr:hypothetical protein [Flavimobilis marinus]
MAQQTMKLHRARVVGTEESDEPMIVVRDRVGCRTLTLGCCYVPSTSINQRVARSSSSHGCFT